MTRTTALLTTVALCLGVVMVAGPASARPTDGAHDPFGDGYTVPATQRCSTHFCLHWVRTTADAPPSQASVRKTLRTLEHVYHHHVVELGYRAPPSDGGVGGSATFDVYLKQLGDVGVYGYCAPERRVAGRPAAASSFCVLDNDFSRAEFHTRPVDALKVTVAHEFFHAIQFGYDAHEDRWILEATAVWMEEQFADGVNDNRMYLPYGQVAIPSVPLDTFSNTDFEMYGNWPFFEYLSEHYGTGIVRKIWQHLGDGKSRKEYSIQAVATVLARYGGLTTVYTAFAAGNTVPAQTYSEGAAFPLPEYAAQQVLSREAPTWTRTTEVRHLAAEDDRITPAATLPADTRLDLQVQAPGTNRAVGAEAIVHTTAGAIQELPITLDGQGSGALSVDFDPRRTTSVSVTLANASTRFSCHRGTTYSCAGEPLDDHQQFRLTATVDTR